MADFAAIWVDLLRRLDHIGPGIGVWKNSHEALAGNGDIDYVARRSTWPAIVSEFRSWAYSHGLEYLPPCLHRPGTLYLLAVDREGRRLMQLDVREKLIVAGAEIVSADDLATLLVEEDKGFRQLRPGAEAALKMLTKSIDRNGRLRHGSLEAESVANAIGADVAGARHVASLVHQGRRAADRLVVSITADQPDEAAARSLMRSMRTAAILHPRTAMRLAVYRLRRRWCPTLAWILSHGQQVPQQLDRWVADVRRVHHNAESWLDLEALEEPAGGTSGAFIVIAGPDGVGKSTLREGLTEALRRCHPVWSGRLSGPLSELRRSSRPGVSREGQVLLGKAASGIRVLYLFGDALLRWLSWTKWWLARGGWVVTERGWWDIAVYPSRYRVGSVGRLHRVLGMVGPRPDLILVLEAAADEVLARKAELSESEIRHQTEVWRSVIPDHQPRVYLDARLSPEALLDRALRAIEKSTAVSPPIASGP